MYSPKISVIITIYNSENYITPCVNSLFNQTLEEIEYIFINDATQDNSIEKLHCIIGDFPNRKPSVKIINLNKNKGVSNARRIGLENATGEYIIHCDSDDWSIEKQKRQMQILSDATSDMSFQIFSMISVSNIQNPWKKISEGLLMARYSLPYVLR